jgi:hypothetical protein
MPPKPKPYEVIYDPVDGLVYSFPPIGYIPVPLPSGPKPIVIQLDDQTTTATTGTAWAPTALTATITPKAGSKVKITISGNGSVDNVNNGMNISLLRGVTELSVSGSGFSQIVTGAAVTRYPVSFSYIDSPATTTPVTYTLAINSGTNGQNVTWNPAGNDCVIILEEVLA